MTERTRLESGHTDGSFEQVPRARSLSLFSATTVGLGDTVLFDTERMTYHSLNSAAFAVWQLCDGRRDTNDIFAALAETSHALAIEAIELAILELAEAGLLEDYSTNWHAQVNRRNIVKLATASMLGTAVLPAITSVTAPHSVSADSHCGENVEGYPCSSSTECQSCCCCGTVNFGNCADGLTCGGRCL